MEKSESLYTAVGNVNCLSNHGKQYGNFSKIKNRTTIVVVATIQCSVISNSLWLHGLQYARLLCPSPSPRAYSNPCPLNQWCHPTIPSSITSSHPLLLLPSIFPSIKVFSNQSALHIRWPNYWSFSFSISPSNEYSGLISFSWLFWSLAVQGMLKSLLEHHSSKASILQYSAFFTIQFSHL